MRTFAKVFLVIYIVAVIVIAVLFLFVQLNNSVSEGLLTREVYPSVLLGSGSSQVDITFSNQPDLDCPMSWRATNFVFLLDRSESMSENNAFDDVLQAAHDFLTVVDTDSSQLAIIYFDNTAEVAHELSSDVPSLRNALSGHIPDGGTNFIDALSSADLLLQNELSGGSLRSVVVIFTDGGAQDAHEAETLGQIMSDKGIRIITIGSESADHAFLREIASRSSDYFNVASEPQNLSDIYTSLAGESNNAVAFNANLVEPVNNGFIVQENSIQPQGLFDASINEIAWEEAVLTDAGAIFEYGVDSTKIGINKINSEEAVISYEDCIAGPVTATLPPGPYVLNLPPLPFLGLFALLGLLPPVLLAMTSEKGSGGDLPSPMIPMNDTQRPLQKDTYPPWIKRLDEKKILSLDLAREKSDEFQPTVIIGVGLVGRIVLSQIAQILRGRYGPQIPDEIRLLQIDIHDVSNSRSRLERPDYLKPNEWVLLTPHLDQVAENVREHPQDWEHLDWYEATMPEYARSRGRMALFYDLKDGADNSVVWKSLTRIALGLDHPKLRVIGSTFDDASSGLLVDIARLMQIIKKQDIDVELWLSGPVGRDWSPRLHEPGQEVRASDQASRTLATLRELERFQQNVPIPFHYVTSRNVQNQLRQDSKAAVVQTLFLFEQLDEGSTIDDHLTTISDCVLALLHQSAQNALGDHLSQSASLATSLINDEGIGMVCSLAAYGLRLPLAALNNAISWRIVYEILFERQVGLLPVVLGKADGSYEPYDPEDLPKNRQRDLDTAEAFVRTYKDQLGTPGFRSGLSKQLSDILNGDNTPGVAVINRIGGLIKAERWLKTLRAILGREGNLKASRLVSRLHQDVVGWREILETLQEPVYGEMTKAQDSLYALRQHSGRHWVIPEDGDWGVYKEKIRPWTTGLPSSNTAGEPLLRAGQRFGWHVEFNELSNSWTIDLLVPEGNFIWSDKKPVDMKQLALPHEAKRIIEAMHSYAVPLAVTDDDSQYLLKLAMGIMPPSEWVEKVEPSDLQFNEMEASRRMGGLVNEALLLVAPKSDEAFKLEEAIQNTPSAPNVRLCDTGDESAVTLLYVRDRVPLYTYKLFDQEKWDTEFVIPSLYVWRGEQIAGEVETEGPRLGLIFVTWLERDPSLVDLLARAYILDLLAEYETYVEIPSLGRVSGATIGDALRVIFNVDSQERPQRLRRIRDREQALQEMEKAIQIEQDEYWTAPGKRTYLDWVKTELIPPLQKSEDQIERDFSLYVRSVIRKMQA